AGRPRVPSPPTTGRSSTVCAPTAGTVSPTSTIRPPPACICRNSIRCGTRARSSAACAPHAAAEIASPTVAPPTAIIPCMPRTPDVTVAALPVAAGRFLVVEERINHRLVFNQPAGHVEHGETLFAAVVREVREETAWRFEPQGAVGVYPLGY